MDEAANQSTPVSTPDAGQAAPQAEPAQAQTQEANNTGGASGTSQPTGGNEPSATEGNDVGNTTPDEPANLNSAIEQYFTGEYDRAKAAESAAEHPEGLQAGGADGDAKADTPTEPTADAKPEGQTQPDANKESGESNNSTVQFNRGQYLRQVEESIKREATNQIRDQINKAGKIIEASPRNLIDQELYKKEGIKRYINPDTKEALPDFQAAKAWCDMHNAEVKEDLNHAINQRSNELREQVKGGVQLQVFLQEVWPTLSEAEQNTLDQMVTPYAMYGRDAQGMRYEQPYAFNCDLFQMAELAKLKTKADAYDKSQTSTQTQQTTPQQSQVQTPALDANTAKGKSEAPEKKVEDLKSYEEAMEYLNEHPELNKRRF